MSVVKRYGDDILRLTQQALTGAAGGLASNQPLPPAINTPPIDGVRTIGYVDANGNGVLGLSGGIPGQSTLGPVTNGNGAGQTNANSNQSTMPAGKNGGGSKIDPKNPQNNISWTDPKNGQNDNQPITAFPTNPATDTPTTLKDVNNFESGLGGDLVTANGGGTANIISNIHDCASGKDIQLLLNSSNPSFIPPPGWTDAETPPPGKGWVKGTGWYAPLAIAGPAAQGGSAFDAASSARDASGDGAKTEQVDATFSTVGHVGGSQCWTFTFAEPGHEITGPWASYSAFDQSCIPSPTNPYCPLYPPASSQWPTGLPAQFKVTDGKFQTSTYQPPADIPTALADGQHSIMNVCYGTAPNERHYQIEPTNNGGYMVTETNASNVPLPGSIVVLLDSNNKANGFVGVAEAAAYRIAPP